MSDASPSPAPPAIPTGPAGGAWIAHFSAEGRPYWNNTVTKVSVWEKPDELKTELELEMGKTSWKEYETNGRKYWVNKESGETTWDMPQVLQDILAKFPPTPMAQRPPPFLPNSQSPAPLNAQSGALVGPGGAGAGGFGPGTPALPPRPVVPVAFVLPDYATHAEAERAFMKMLKTIGVTPSWTWEQTMRETITDPYYKALRTLAERKAAFEKFVKETIEAEKQDREKSLERWRKDWNKALEKLGGGTEREDGVKSWWRWEGLAKKDCERKMNAEVWKGPRSDEERKTLFEEFTSMLKLREATKKRELRVKNIEKVTSILQGLSLDLAGAIRWRDAQGTIHRTPEWLHDNDLQKIDPIDVLTIFEEEVRKAEKERTDARAKAAEQKRRRARKAREEFMVLLTELQQSGQIVAGTLFKSIYPLLEGDERYQNLLGTPGSSPLDLFWDVVDSLDLKAEEEQRRFEAMLDTMKLTVSEQTTFEEFVSEVGKNEKAKDHSEPVVAAVFEKLRARAIRQAKEERRRSEKVLRLQIDDLRYAFKKLDPPVDLDATYEDILPRIESAPEFVILTDEPARRTAFEKFIKRQREKAKEREAQEDSIGEFGRDREGGGRGGSHRTRGGAGSDGERGGERYSRPGPEKRAKYDRGGRESSMGEGEEEKDGGHRVKRGASTEEGLEGGSRKSKVPKRETSSPASPRSVRGGDDVKMRDAKLDEEAEEGEIE